MNVLDAMWALESELIDGRLDIISQSLNEIANDEIACTVEAVVAMNANIVLLCPALLLCSDLLCLTEAINQFDEPCDLVICWWYLFRILAFCSHMLLRRRLFSSFTFFSPH